VYCATNVLKGSFSQEITKELSIDSDRKMCLVFSSLILIFIEVS
jgi:hypothetical protein